MGPNEVRLLSAFVYTDDELIVVIGASRTVHVLGTWGKPTGDVNALLAGESKRQIGSCLLRNSPYFQCSNV